MFQGKNPEAAPRHLLEPDARGSEPLRPLSWADLVNRLAAARDLRAPITALPADETGAGHAATSFDAGSARRITGRYDGKIPVNLEDSGNGKVTVAEDRPTKEPGKSPANRGKQ